MNDCIGSRYNDEKILNRVDWRVIGLKLIGSALSPFLYTRTVTPRRHTLGTIFDSQHTVIKRCSIVLNIGHRFSMIMLIWSKGHGEAPPLALLTARDTSLYVGGWMFAGWVGGRKLTNHDEMENLSSTRQDSILKIVKSVFLWKRRYRVQSTV